MPNPPHTRSPPRLATHTMTDRLPCPIPGCNNSRTGPNRHFSSKSTLLRHLNHDDHKTTFHLADQSICTTVNIYSCLHPTFLPNLTNTLLPIPQRPHSIQRLTSSTATNTFTRYHRPPPTHIHQRSQHQNIDLLHRQPERISQPMASWNPLHLTTH